jgi:hypothetical protein
LSGENGKSRLSGMYGYHRCGNCALAKLLDSRKRKDVMFGTCPDSKRIDEQRNIG